MIELPNFLPLRVQRRTSGLSAAHAARLDHLVVIVPLRPTTAHFSRLPQRNKLAKLARRADRGDSRIIHSRLPNDEMTGVSIACTKRMQVFEAMTWARKTLARILEDQPQRVGVVVRGFSPEDASLVRSALVAAADAAAFRLAAFKSKRPRRRRPLASLTLFETPEIADLEEQRAAAFGNNIARWLTSLPPNKLTVSSYREAVGEIVGAHGLKTDFFGERRLASLKAGAFLAVSQGNPSRDAGIIRISYRPKRESKPALALVGKGILFDTGGVNLKPFKSMLNMHTDMQGSAVALGTLVALARLGVPYGVDAWLAVTENRVSGTAYKSQDVVEASNGTTIQVIHTDAEGRMVLADTLAIAAREEPKLILDYATLTGTCVSALSTRYSGVFTNRGEAHAPLVAAGRASGERVWPFPMDEDYEEPLSSDVADIKQCAVEGTADHILAARFLSRFVPERIPWIHVDMSASRHAGGLGAVPTELNGFGVRFTLALLHALEADAATRGIAGAVFEA